MRTVQNNRVWRRARCCLGALAAAAPQLRRGHKSEARRNGGVGRLVCVLERAELGGRHILTCCVHDPRGFIAYT